MTGLLDNQRFKQEWDWGPSEAAGSSGTVCHVPDCALLMRVMRVTRKFELGELRAERSGVHVLPGQERELASQAGNVAAPFCLARQQPVTYSCENHLCHPPAQEPAMG